MRRADGDNNLTLLAKWPAAGRSAGSISECVGVATGARDVVALIAWRMMLAKPRAKVGQTRERRSMRIVLALVCVFALWTGAEAADIDPVSPAPLPERMWDVRIQPYLWASAMSGTTKPFRRLPPVDVDMRFSDILEDLKFAGMVAGSAHYGRWGVAGDLQYVVLKSGANTPGPAFAGANVKAESFIGTVLADYKIIDANRGTLYGSAGVRVYNAKTTVTLNPGLLPGTAGSGSDTWADPMVGLRGTFDITPKVFVNGWGLVGGFGVGSDIAADLFGGAGYRFTDHIAANVGYRWLKVDRDTTDFVYDIEQHGAMAGLVISF